MRSPPFIKVAEVAITSLTVMSFFFIAFFSADFVKASMKIPTPYSCSRIGEGILGTICISVELIMVLIFANIYSLESLVNPLFSDLSNLELIQSICYCFF